MGSRLITNGRIVTRDSVTDGCILICDGLIHGIYDGMPRNASFDEAVDAGGAYLLPGLVDIHNDAVDTELEPRPNTMLPFDVFFYETDKKLAASGITCVYHSLSYGEGAGVRNFETVAATIRKINSFREKLLMIRHEVHLRYEISYNEGLDTVMSFLEKKLVGYVSYMDHTPGWGQYATDSEYMEWARDAWGLKDMEAHRFMKDLRKRKKRIEWKILEEICSYAANKGINVACHDSYGQEDIDRCRSWGIKVCEFPVNREAAAYATSKGMLVCVGAPNLARGGSHLGNLSAAEAIAGGTADIICSDYSFSCLLPAVFKAAEILGDLPKAVRMATFHPACAVGIEKTAGSIEEGKKADLVFVEIHDGYPYVRRTIVNGETVFRGDYFRGSRTAESRDRKTEDKK